MDNGDLRRLLETGAEALAIQLPPDAATGLLLYQAELLRWNQKMNLTAITDPAEVVEKHLLDSIAVAPEVGVGGSLLDVGTGAGLPGLALKLVEPTLEVTLVDSVQKKIGFVKAAAAALRLTGVRAAHARLSGHPDAEGVGLHRVVISRALTDLVPWLALARPYLAAGGRVVSMLGKAPVEAADAGDAVGLRLVSVRGFALPFSKAERHVAVYEPK